MDKKAVLAIVLSFLVLYFYQSFFAPDPVEIPFTETSGTESSGEKTVDKPPETKEIKKKVGESDALFSPQQIKTAVEEKKGHSLTITEEKISLFDGDKFAAKFSTLGGGGIKSLILKDYKESLEVGSPGVERIEVEKNEPLPLSITFKGGNHEVSSRTIFEETKNSGNELEYSWDSGDGITVTKKYLFHPHSYAIDVDISVINRSNKPLTGTMTINLFEKDIEKGDMYTFIGQAVKIGDDIDKEPFEDIEETAYILEGDIKWLATENKYFISALIPKFGGTKRVSATRLGENLISSAFVHKDISLPAGGQKNYSYSFYSGPKDLYLLQEFGVGLEKAIDMGWFHGLAEPLLRFLKYIYSYTGNYGYAIIILTMLIKIVFFPLSTKSYRSMKGMQKLQPLMNELKEKYKDDKSRMGREVMALYKKHKVNPLSGCIPMILQIPVFIALYNVLLNAIELRHAPFHFWIIDMSTKDPYYVTPVIMGLTMFLQQKMTPTTPDPMQQKVMMMMPFIFTFMFMNLPSGLVLYWVVNNMLSIGQQYYILKKP